MVVEKGPGGGGDEPAGPRPVGRVGEDHGAGLDGRP